MKKFFCFALMAVAAMNLNAQNVQLHYDLGRNIYSNEEDGRQKVTLTLEQFKADKWGSWFYFVDLDFNRKETMAAYAEISRELNIGKQGFAAHVEYNGGLSSSPFVGSYQQAALLGGAWNGHSADFSKTYSVQLMYKRYFKDMHDNRAYNSFQLTGVWGLNFANNKCRFAGFIDFWRGEKANGHGQLVVLSEPQFWYNVTNHFSIGTEIEFSNNFVFNTDPNSDKSFFVNPTLGVKWNF